MDYNLYRELTISLSNKTLSQLAIVAVEQERDNMDLGETKSHLVGLVFLWPFWILLNSLPAVS